MLASRLSIMRASLVIALYALTSGAGAQTATSTSFSLESSLLTGAARATSSSFSAETCISPGMGGVTRSTSFALTTGCGAMITLSNAEISALGLVQAEAAPVIVPTLSEWARLALLSSVFLAGLIALNRRGRRTRASKGASNLPT